jgi:ribosome-binding protein aMBF1 (putative translation factor)
VPTSCSAAGQLLTNQQLEDETEELKRKPRLALEAVLPLRPVRNAELTSAECPPATDQTVSADLKKAIMQARNAKGMSQKDLAQKLMTDVKTVQEYESGKAIPNNALIAKMERELGAKLPRAPKK